MKSIIYNLIYLLRFFLNISLIFLQLLIQLKVISFGFHYIIFRMRIGHFKICLLKIFFNIYIIMLSYFKNYKKFKKNTLRYF